MISLISDFGAFPVIVYINILLSIKFLYPFLLCPLSVLAPRAYSHKGLACFVPTQPISYPPPSHRLEPTPARVQLVSCPLPRWTPPLILIYTLYKILLLLLLLLLGIYNIYMIKACPRRAEMRPSRWAIVGHYWARWAQFNYFRLTNPRFLTPCICNLAGL